MSDKVEFITDFKVALSDLREHASRVTTQYEQIRKVRSDMQPGTECTIQMDYAENYNCVYQDEIGAVHYDRNQVSLHPMVIHYRDDTDTLQHISIVGVTEERSHTIATTMAFIQSIQIKVKAILPKLNTVPCITDSPSSQYRNKTVVALLANHKKMFGTAASWQWLEAGHGKGPCDGVGGSVKKMAENAVKAGAIISDTNTFFSHFTSINSTMEFVRVTTNDVIKCRTIINKWKITAVNGLLSAHAMVQCDGVFFWRKTSCFGQCYYEKGTFHPSCPGWTKTDITTLQTLHLLKNQWTQLLKTHWTQSTTLSVIQTLTTLGLPVIVKAMMNQSLTS